MAAWSEGPYPAQSTRANSLLNIPPEQAEVKLPNNKAVFAVLAIGVLLSAATGGTWVWYAQTDDRIDPREHSKEWRITTTATSTSDWQGWKVCALIPYADDYCNGDTIDIKSATISGLPNVPDKWKDYNEAASKDGSFKEECVAPWSAASDDSATVENPPYLQWTFKSSIRVGCFKVQYLKDSEKGYSEIAPLNVQAKTGGSWKTTRSQSTTIDAEVANVATGFSGYLKANPMKTTLLVAAIVLSVFAGCTLLLITPIVWCAVHSELDGRTALREEVRQGSALTIAVPQRQWAEFVEEEWGPGGVVHQEQYPWWCWLIGTVICIPVTVVIVKLKSLGRTPLDWMTCLFIAVPLVCVVMFAMYVATKVSRRVRYNQLKRDRYPAIIGTSSLYFADVFVPESQICASVVEIESGKITLTVHYKSGDEDQKITVPIPEDRVEEVKAFLRTNKENFGFVEASDIELGDATNPPPDTAQNVVMVTPVAVQVVDPPAA
mmetsp:Transcript_27081/g.58977  ORF Transcript_27081/g.58977 Transcript_27081/m.58977 type:complete len:492 (+) Transcript_27081:159-1634(+)